MLNEVKHLAKSLAESTERSFTCFEIFSGKALNNTSPPYSRRNDKNMMIVRLSRNLVWVILYLYNSF